MTLRVEVKSAHTPLMGRKLCGDTCLLLACSVGIEGMTPINHFLWFRLREPLDSFPHSRLSTSKSGWSSKQE